MQDFLRQLDLYEAAWKSREFRHLTDDGEERNHLTRFRELLKSALKPFDRGNYPGHVTGSAVILTHDFDQMLLTHHRKLDLWIQLGGHLEADATVAEGAMREAREESGLTNLRFHSWSKNGILPFDVDIHTIPANSKEPEHEHFDVRYLFVTDTPDKIRVSEESKSLQWFSVGDLLKKEHSRAMERQLQKITVLI